MPKLDWLTLSEDEKDAAHLLYRLPEAVPEHMFGILTLGRKKGSCLHASGTKRLLHRRDTIAQVGNSETWTSRDTFTT